MRPVFRGQDIANLVEVKFAALPREPFRQMVRDARGARPEEAAMPLFLIERNFAEAVELDPETMATIKQVNDEIGIQWLFSFLSADKRKTYCSNRDFLLRVKPGD
jgi:hypothetical protein